MKYLLILISILLLSLVTAFYPGEVKVFDNPLRNENLVWTIIENTTPLTILPVVSYNTTNITIFFPSNMPPNSFSIVFMDEQTREVVTTIYSGGGGGSHTVTKYINQTETKYINVPEYVDKEVEVEKIVYVNNTEEVISDGPITSNNKKLAMIGVGIFLFLLALYLFVKIQRSNRVIRRLEKK